ncbi:translation initiation factor IF-2-like [Lutra lutra]|uniref:translation initiation factor IF-2-like n=1 Tax=Lutra lutra TaxID=9657 RepID=UPI001FD42E76|nr:translation initiation factor IF-2-like [Lutra lutra]
MWIEGLQLERCFCRMLSGQNERLESRGGARDAGEGGSGAEEAANEAWARKQAGKGGKGQRAAKEGEKGKLQQGGSGRRGGTRWGARGRGKGKETGAWADPGRGCRGGAERPRPGPARPRQSTPGGTTRREAGGPRGSRPRPVRAHRPKRDAAAPPRHVKGLTSSQLGAPGIRSRQFRSSLADRSA